MADGNAATGPTSGASGRDVIPAISWIHVGDLHMDEADDWLAAGRLRRIVADANIHIGRRADFLFLPGDNANHATAEQYRAIVDALDGLHLPFRVIPGDHDFEDGTLAAYRAAFTETVRPDVEVIAGHRCIFLDIVSSGAGGPDFRLTMHHRRRLAEELARAEAEGQTPLVFMHAYPGDLAADGDAVAQQLADARVAFVDTGHTHYNELLNDGRVVYGATRSSAQIEEDGGAPGFALVTVYDQVPSWRFKTLDSGWPFVQIVAPADVRMVTRPADPRQVPRPGPVEIVAKVYGDQVGEVRASHGSAADVPMTYGSDGFWRATLTLPDGLHDVTVTSPPTHDTIRLLIRGADDIPRRGTPVALGRDVHAVGAWRQHGIDGGQLGPNKNGHHW